MKKYKFIGDWGLGIGDWGLGIGPNPQSPIPMFSKYITYIFYNLFKIKNGLYKIFIWKKQRKK